MGAGRRNACNLSRPGRDHDRGCAYLVHHSTTTTTSSSPPLTPNPLPSSPFPGSIGRARGRPWRCRSGTFPSMPALPLSLPTPHLASLPLPLTSAKPHDTSEAGLRPSGPTARLASDMRAWAWACARGENDPDPHPTRPQPIFPLLPLPSPLADAWRFRGLSTPAFQPLRIWIRSPYL